MKRIIKSMMLLAVAATAFTACNKEVDNQEPAKKDGMMNIRFSAVVNDAETKATLTTEDEKTFTAAWENGDAMAIEALSVDADYDETGIATWNGSFFDTNLPANETLGEWTYDGFYPAKTDIPFGSARVQNGSNYASAYDVMKGDVTYQNALLGKDPDGGNMVIPMTRLTSIVYFHLTSNLDEALASATLTVEGGDIAAETVSINNGAIEAGAEGSDAITITFAEGTAPNAQDFRLWFNILPVQATALTLTVTSASGKTATLSNTKGKSYVAGKLNKIVKSGLTWEEGPFFYESFDQTSGTGGNDDQWSGSIASSTVVTDNEGWTFDHEGGASQCVKIGTGSAKGYALTPALGITSDLATVTFKAGAWNKDKTTLLLSVEGNGVLSENEVTMENNAWSDYTVYIAGADVDTKIKFYTDVASRFFLDEVKVVEGGTAFDYLMVPSLVNADYDATTASFEIKTGSAWTISGAEGVQIDKTSGEGNATVTLTFPVNETASDITIATLTVTAGDKTATVTIKQAGNPDAIEELTIAEFLTKEVGDAYYRLTGTITDLENTTYGNFTLVDETGSVYVYGLTKEKVTSNDKSFAEIGVVEGDIVTLEGKRAVHNDTPQVGGPAYYISHVKAPSLSVDPEELIFAAEGGSKTVSVTANNFGENLTISAVSNSSQFTATVSGNTITVVAAENTGNEVKTGEITVTATDGANTKTAKIDVSQNKPAQPAQDGDILWQEDFTGYGTTMPSTATGSHVFGGGTVSYTLTNGGSTTKLYAESSAGGSSPELLVSKANGSFKISGIPTGSAATMTLTYNANYDYCVVSASDGITLRDDVTYEDKVKTICLIVPTGVASFDLEFKNTNSNSNCRVDNFLLKAGAPKVKASQTISFGDNKDIEWIIGTDCTLNSAKQGLTVTGNETTVTYESLNPEIATVDNNGMVTPLQAGTVVIKATAEETEDYKEATDQYTLTITDPNVVIVTKTYTLTLSASDIDAVSSGSGYAVYNGEHTAVEAVADDGSTFEVVFATSQVMPGTGDYAGKIQFQGSSSNHGAIYNTTNLGRITSVTPNNKTGNGVLTTTTGNAEQPSGSVEGGFFMVKNTGTKAAYCDSITIVFEK